MTKTEYQALYKKARQETAKLSLKAQVRTNLAYRRAASDVAQRLLDAQERGLSLITIEAQARLLNEIQMASTTLANDIQSITTELVSDATKINTQADRDYMLGLVIGPEGPINVEIIKNVYSKLNTKAIQNMVSRVYSDGYTFSSRVWNLKGDFENTIKEILTSGIAQGRDPVKLIKDLQVYVADGKTALAERWGGLERGTDEWKKRIHEKIDYRAQRLVRSELHATMQDVSIEAGEANLATTGDYEWILGPGLAHCSDCIDYSLQTFTKETIPSYPHPNCGCQIRPVLRDRKKFVDDLKRWKNGTVDEENRYVDDWVQKYTNAA